MKKLLQLFILLLPLVSFGQFEAGEWFNGDTAKIHGESLIYPAPAEGEHYYRGVRDPSDSLDAVNLRSLMQRIAVLDSLGILVTDIVSGTETVNTGTTQIYFETAFDSNDVTVVAYVRRISDNAVIDYYLSDIDSNGFDVTVWDDGVVVQYIASQKISHSSDIFGEPIYSADSSYIKSGIRSWNSSLAKTIDAADTTWWGRAETDPKYAADSANTVRYVGNDRDLNMGANSISADTVKSSILTSGYVPYYNLGLRNSGFYWDAVNNRVGLGTINPSSKFHLYTDLSLDGEIMSTVDANSTTIKMGVLRYLGSRYPGIWLNQSTPSVTNYAFLYAGGTVFNTPTSTSIFFRVANSNKMVIYQDGNIGIGTLTPSVKLHVISTAEQLRLGYDASNYLSFTIGSTGDASLAATGLDINSNSRLNFTGVGRQSYAKYTAASITLTAGTSTSTVTDLQTMTDGTYYTLVEAAATPGIDMYVEFTSVTAFEKVRILGGYSGAATHALAIQLYNWTTSTWNTFHAMQNDYVEITTPVLGNYEFTVYSDVNYIGTAGNAGKVRVRFLHPMAGNPSHNLYLDEVSLRQ